MHTSDAYTFARTFGIDPLDAAAADNLHTNGGQHLEGDNSYAGSDLYADDDGFSVVSDWGAHAQASIDLEPAPQAVSAGYIMDAAVADAVATQTMVNLLAARQLFAVRDAVHIAGDNPQLYLPSAVMGGSASPAGAGPSVDARDFAERSVAFDLAHRLHVSENTVRAWAHQADVLSSSLPRLCELFVAGAVSVQHVRAAVDASAGILDEAAMTAFDERLAGIAEGLRAGEFRRRARLLRERLCADTLQQRHEEARTKRRVSVEPDHDGMAWLNVYLPVVDAARVESRLGGTARRLRNAAGETRTLDQLRADLAIDWLTGGDTPAAATVQPVLLIDEAGRYAELLGYGPVPPKSAGRALRDAPAFRKVIADPGRPSTLVLDASRYRPTADQRLWLRIRYGLDDDAAPYLSPDADIDHVVEWHDGGTTDVANLVPLKPRLHRLKSVTGIRLDPKPGGGIRVRTPTGYDSDPPPF
ncbi:HNH endonuclease signature motif containing protein [Humibacter ginsenosidimutans]|nr:HNH endonuclease signature motif containing protein [Humibacter ginsenosidimutans]